MKNRDSLKNRKIARFRGSYVNPQDFPTDKKQICFLGRSNSGKSTLLSALLANPKIVKVSSVPGSTQTINFYEYGNIYLVDLPGYGYTAHGKKKSRELSQIMEIYLTKNFYLKAGFLLLDCVRQPKEEELAIAEFFLNQKIPLFLLLTKSDKLNQKQKAKILKEIKTFEKFFHLIWLISAHNKEGVDRVLNFILSLGD